MDGLIGRTTPNMGPLQADGQMQRQTQIEAPSDTRLQSAQAKLDALPQFNPGAQLSASEQQQQAFNDFNLSPGQQFLRDRGQKNLIRNAGALGGLGGGNVRSALVQQGIGFAQQDFDNQFNRLGDLRSAGQNAATNIGQGMLNTGGNIASTYSNTANQLGAGAINSASGQAQAGANFANQFSANQLAAGNARASGLTNQSNAMQNTISGLGNVAGQYFGQSNSNIPSNDGRTQFQLI
jgi:hypothetical protein